MTIRKFRDPIYDSAGGWLKEAREAVRLSRAALAEEVNLSPVAILRYENGTRNIPFHLIPIFARLLEKDISYFFTGLSNADSRPGIRENSTVLGNRAFDVFLSYQKNDEPEINSIADWLTDRGLNVWFEKEQVAPGGWIQDSWRRAISESNSVAIFVGQTGLGRWQVAEHASIARMGIDNGLSVIPVFLPRTEPVFPDYSPLRDLIFVRFNRSTNEEQALDGLYWGIKGEKLIHAQSH